MSKNTPLKKHWPYKHSDKSTWKYIACIVTGDIEKGTAKIKKWIKNPVFIYSHLDPNEDDE